MHFDATKRTNLRCTGSHWIKIKFGLFPVFQKSSMYVLKNVLVVIKSTFVSKIKPYLYLPCLFVDWLYTANENKPSFSALPQTLSKHNHKLSCHSLFTNYVIYCESAQVFLFFCSQAEIFFKWLLNKKSPEVVIFCCSALSGVNMCILYSRSILQA